MTQEKSDLQEVKNNEKMESKIKVGHIIAITKKNTFFFQLLGDDLSITQEIGLALLAHDLLLNALVKETDLSEHVQEIKELSEDLRLGYAIFLDSDGNVSMSIVGEQRDKALACKDTYLDLVGLSYLAAEKINSIIDGSLTGKYSLMMKMLKDIEDKLDIVINKCVIKGGEEQK